MVSTSRHPGKAGDVATPRPGGQVRERVLDLATLAKRAEALRAAGKTIALCHGVFDLMHFGHVRHLEDAARLADVLFVTVTTDRFVNKGPGRPVFTGEIRAEMLAALEFVDATAVNEAPTAVPVLEALKPDIYVKGIDYADTSQDSTGNIDREKAAVEAHGGRIAFTDNVVYSSTELINRQFAIHTPEVREVLNHLRQAGTHARAEEALDAMGQLKVLLIGDTIIDEYRYVAPLGKATKDNIIATQYLEEEIFAGGAIAVARDLAALVGTVDVVTALGTDRSFASEVRSALPANVNLTVIWRNGAPTTRKTRFIEHGFNRKLFEVYDFDDRPLCDGEERTMLHAAIDSAAGYDLVIASDFGHGLIDRGTAQRISANAPFLAVNTQTNAGNTGFNLATKYPSCDYLSLDGPEARLAAGDKYADLAALATDVLPTIAGTQAVMITLGQRGCLFHDTEKGSFEMPAFAPKVVDRIGAGDAVFAVTAPAVKCGAGPDVTALLGNIAGAIKVETVGHRAGLDRLTLSRSLKALLT